MTAIAIDQATDTISFTIDTDPADVRDTLVAHTDTALTITLMGGERINAMPTPRANEVGVVTVTLLDEDGEPNGAVYVPLADITSITIW